MGLVLEHALDKVRPFQIVSLDLMGPLSVSEGLGRRKHVVKHWGAVYICLSTRAVACWVVPDYSTDGFMKAHLAHMAIYGTPAMISTDRGMQLMAVAGRTQGMDWGALQHKTAHLGTTWHFVPAGSPWRNGSAERAIRVLKRTFHWIIHAGSLLSPLDLQSFMHRAAGIANECPLTVRLFSVEDFWAISPRDLLLGAAPELSRASEWQVGLEADWEAHLLPRVGAIEDKVQQWWKAYSHDVFPLMVLLRKWQNTGRCWILGRWSW